MVALLSSVRILAVEQYGAGPFATEYLRALGAEVIKVEGITDGGDVARAMGPYFDDGLPETARSLFFQSLNSGKKSINLDLQQPRGREVLARLAAHCDALLHNLRGDVPEKLGLTYASLAPANRAIVCAHLTGYGRQGERAHWPGYDYLMQAETGCFSLTGDPEGPPSRMGLSIIDYMTGVVMALGLVSGIVNARATGVGGDIDVSLFDVALHNLNYLAVWHMNAGAQPSRQPRSAHPSLVPCQLYRTADGWIYLMCNKEKFWASLCRKIGRPEWIDDPRYATFADRLQRREELTERLDGVLQQKSAAQWMEVFAGSVPAAPVLDVQDALRNPFVQAEGRIRSVPTRNGGDLRLLRNPIRFDGKMEPLAAAPGLGQDTEDVLRAAGFGPDEIQDLKSNRVI